MASVIRYIKQYLYPDTQKKNIIMLLEYVLPKFNENNISYWLTDGTLLGCYREHDIIEGDDDADVLILEEEFENAMQILIKDLPDFMEEPNIKAEYQTTCCNTKNGDKFFLGKIDLIKAFKKDDILYKIEDGNQIHFNYDDIFPLKEVDFLNVKAKIPNNTPKILEKLYGNDYMIPRAHYKGPLYKGKQYQPPKFIQLLLPKLKKYLLVILLIIIFVIIYFLKKTKIYQY